jgi:hypothetical protein
MASLAVALESGFDDDHVLVKVSDRLVLDERHVSTRYQIGLARMLEVPVTADNVRIEVRLPSRGLTGETVVHMSRSTGLRVSVESGEVVFSPTDTPLYYA